MRGGTTRKKEEFVDLVRLTIGLRNIENEWIVTHEHHSIPAT